MSKNVPLQGPTILNAKRLLADAVLLKRRRRIHSSVAMSVQAIEELGKALILRWEVRNKGNSRKFPNHIEKQTATFALLCASELLANGGKLQRRLLYEEGVNFSNLGPYSEQFAQARSGFYENLRQAVTYDDEEPIFSRESVEGIGPALPSELIAFFRKAMSASRDSRAMGLAAEIYSNDLGRL